MIQDIRSSGDVISQQIVQLQVVIFVHGGLHFINTTAHEQVTRGAGLIRRAAPPFNANSK